MRDFIIQQFDDRLICIEGVGKLFYQEGFPICLSVSEFKKIGIEVSILHVADECLKNGWSAETTYRKLMDDFQDDIENNTIDEKQLYTFCHSSYEDQRTMIFNYLFGSTEKAGEWLKKMVA